MRSSYHSSNRSWEPSKSGRTFEQPFEARFARVTWSTQSPNCVSLWFPHSWHGGPTESFFELKWAQWLAETIPGVTKMVEIEGGRLFFPDERANDLVPHVRRHWAMHPA